MESLPTLTSSPFSKCNRTELYQLCRKAGLEVGSTWSRDLLIQALEGGSCTSVIDPIDLWRDAIMRFLLDHWTVVESQLTCPAKSGDPKSCYKCVDAQVIACVVQQTEPDQKLIALRRKPR